jgi:ABC-2 type transport system ATP-binding protein
MSIVVRELTKCYGAHRAVDGVSFELGNSGLVGLIGPNGAGKSTILRIISTFLSPTSGQIVVAGCDSMLDPQGESKSTSHFAHSSKAFLAATGARRSTAAWKRVNCVPSAAG